MYDKIKIEQIIDKSIANKIRVVDWHALSNKISGEVYGYGKIVRNMDVKYISDSSKLIINGSITKFWKCHNLYNLSIEEIKSAIIELSNAIRLDLNAFKVIQLEIGLNVILNKIASDYNRLFFRLNKHKKSIISDFETVYFNSTKLKVISYDKIKEHKKKNKQIKLPNEFIGCNLLRFEILIKKGVCKYFNINELLLSDLINPLIWDASLNMLQDTFIKIEKSKEIKQINDENLLPKEGIELLASFGLQKIEQEIPNIDLIKMIPQKANRSNFNRSLKHLRNNNFTTDNILINELSDAIKDEINILKLS
jgi:Phage replication protein CRI